VQSMITRRADLAVTIHGGLIPAEFISPVHEVVFLALCARACSSCLGSFRKFSALPPVLITMPPVGPPGIPGPSGEPTFRRFIPLLQRDFRLVGPLPATHHSNQPKGANQGKLRRFRSVFGFDSTANSRAAPLAINPRPRHRGEFFLDCVAAPQLRGSMTR
jgi:hypothetical protein